MKNNKQLFLQELKDQYNAQFERSDALEAKTGQLITVCGIFIPLLFGFSSVVIDRADNNDTMALPLAALVVVSLSLAVACIFFCAWALRIRDYQHVVPSESFFDNQRKLNKQEITKFVEQEEEAYYDKMIEDYLLSTDENFKTNDEKGGKVRIAQFMFLGGLAIVPILLIFSFSFLY